LDWFYIEYGINDIYILNRKNVQCPLHVISNTCDLKLINSITKKNRLVLTTVSYHIFNFTLLLAANQMTNIPYN
jgi:hypothetical protein